MSESVYGSCLCGGVRFEVSGTPKLFQYCHCERCRKVSGTAHGANFFVADDDFRWTSGAKLRARYDLPGAKYFASAFCTRCGSALPWSTMNGAVFVVPAGAMDSPLPFKPTQNIYWAFRAGWYEAPETLACYDERPPSKRRG